MRKTVLILLLVLLLGIVFPAGADLYLDQEPPAEWADREDLMRRRLSMTAPCWKSAENQC